MFDFRGLRLDWARLQSYLSSGKGSVLEKQRELAALLNTVRWETIKCVSSSVADPDPPDPHVFGPPGKIRIRIH